ncbi:MAG: hypothetical protein H8E98_02000 [Bacteroidetes bacterium]|nr:hypothetical protein [Bacteroidota bacterium]
MYKLKIGDKFIHTGRHFCKYIQRVYCINQYGTWIICDNDGGYTYSVDNEVDTSKYKIMKDKEKKENNENKNRPNSI